MYTNYCPCWWDTTTCEGCGRQVETTMHMLCFCSRGTEVWRACKLALPCIVKESWSFVDTFSRLRTSWEAQPELLERWVTICLLAQHAQYVENVVVWLEECPSLVAHACAHDVFVFQHSE